MRRGLIIGLVLGLAVQADAVIFHDGASNAQRIMEFIWMQAQEVQKYAQMVETYHQQVEQVRQTVLMVEQGAKHLADMPEQGKVLDWITEVTNETSAVLSQVQGLGFHLEQSAAQFEGLYKNVLAMTNPAGVPEQIRRMQAARLEMTGIGIQVQSIRTSFGSIFQRITALLGASSLAEGTKALQQVQIQQQALMQQQQQLGVTMQAVSARLDAMKHAEEIVLRQLAHDAAEHNARLWYGGMNVQLPPGYDGYMINPSLGR